MAQKQPKGSIVVSPRDIAFFDENQKKVWLDTILKPSVEAELKDVTAWRFRWNKIANIIEVIGKIIAGFAAVIAFAAGYFQNQYPQLAFAAGAVGTFGVVLTGFAAYAKQRSDNDNGRFIALLNDWGANSSAGEIQKITV